MTGYPEEIKEHREFVKNLCAGTCCCKFLKDGCENLALTRLPQPSEQQTKKLSVSQSHTFFDVFKID